MSVCLLYHGVHRRDHYAGFAGHRGLTAAGFDRHLRVLRRLFEVVPAHQLDAVPARRGWRPRVAITFDDGFANFVDVAYPVLVRHQVPATIFVSTGFLDGGPPLWFSRLHVACLFGPERPLELGGQRYGRASAAERERSLAAIAARLAGLPWARARDLLDELPDPRTLIDGERARDLVDGLSLAELRRLAADPLITIGSHTVSHPPLTRCDGDTVLAELAASRRALEAAIERPVTDFAYPQGDYDVAVRDAARRCYQRAWAVTPRMPVPDRGFERERFGVYGPPLGRLLLKAAGAARWVRRAGRPIG